MLESPRRRRRSRKPRPHFPRPRPHFPQALTLYPEQTLISLCLLPKQLKSFRSWLESAGEAGGGGQCWGRGWRETKPSSSLETVCSADGLLKILFVLQVQKGKRGDSWVGKTLLVDSCVQEGSGAGSRGWGAHLLRSADPQSSSSSRRARIRGGFNRVAFTAPLQTSADDSATLSLSFLICKMDVTTVPSWWDNRGRR